MLSNGRGELSGTSRMRKPASTSTSPIAGISSGVMPRSTAISGSSLRYGCERLVIDVARVSECPARSRDADQTADRGIGRSGVGSDARLRKRAPV